MGQAFSLLGRPDRHELEAIGRILRQLYTARRTPHLRAYADAEIRRLLATLGVAPGARLPPFVAQRHAWHTMTWILGNDDATNAEGLFAGEPNLNNVLTCESAYTQSTRIVRRLFGVGEAEAIVWLRWWSEMAPPLDVLPSGYKWSSDAAALGFTRARDADLRRGARAALRTLGDRLFSLADTDALPVLLMSGHLAALVARFRFDTDQLCTQAPLDDHGRCIFDRLRIARTSHVEPGGWVHANTEEDQYTGDLVGKLVYVDKERALGDQERALIYVSFGHGGGMSDGAGEEVAEGAARGIARAFANDVTVQTIRIARPM